MRRWVEATLRETRPDTAFLYSSVMGQYLPQGIAGRPGRVVMDFVDVDSVKWGQYADLHSWPMSWIYRRESRHLLRFDRAVARSCDAGILVSAEEAALFRRLAPDAAEKIHAISNGVDHAVFSPDPPPERPFAPGTRAIVMTGAMDYWPNVDGAVWFADAVFPRVLAAVPEARFIVVGGNPTPEVRALAERPSITVTGRVPDVRPYLAHADVVVAPLKVARGIQNKVLEGMAMGRIVVTTPQGHEGIEAQADRDLLVAADQPETFAAACLRGLTDPTLAGLGQRARARVVAAYDWNDKLAAYDRLLEGE